MSAILKISETGTVVAEGAMLRHKDGMRWRFDGIVVRRSGDHLIRMVRHQLGKIIKVFPPHVFGCHVESGLQIKFSKSVYHVLTFGKLGEMKSQTLILLYAGVLALLPLAAFEHFHLAAHLFELLGNKSATKGD